YQERSTGVNPRRSFGRGNRPRDQRARLIANVLDGGDDVGFVVQNSARARFGPPRPVRRRSPGAIQAPAGVALEVAKDVRPIRVAFDTNNEVNVIGQDGDGEEFPFAGARSLPDV